VHRYVRATLLVAYCHLAHPAQAALYKEGKVVEFLTKKAPCYAWAFGVNETGMVRPWVFCVFDESVGGGGINEEIGCFASYFDVETERFSDSHHQGQDLLRMVREKCSDRALKKLSEHVASFVAITAGDGLKSAVFGGPGAGVLRELACKESRVLFRTESDPLGKKMLHEQQKVFCTRAVNAKTPRYAPR
jgi:hypothetical protein